MNQTEIILPSSPECNHSSKNDRICSISSSIQLIRPAIIYRNHNFLNDTIIQPRYVNCNIIVVIVVFWKDTTWALCGLFCKSMIEVKRATRCKNEAVISVILSAWILLCFALLKKIIVDAIYDC